MGAVAVAVRAFGVVVGACVTMNHVAVARGASVGVGPGRAGSAVAVAVATVGVGSVVGSHVEPDAQSAVAIAAVPEAKAVAQ